MRRLWIVALLAACAGEVGPTVAERLASRRIALGLDEAFPIPFDKAMHALEEKLEPDLKRAALGRLDSAAAVDAALRIESLLERADLGGKPAGIGEGMGKSARLAETWARAAIRGDSEAARRDARAVLDSCIECHKLYRN
jgi:hypothetical protein